MLGLLNSSHSSSIESLVFKPFQTLKESSLPLCMRCSLTFVKVNKMCPLHLIQGQWFVFNLYTLTFYSSLTHIYLLSLCCCLVSCQNESLIVGNMLSCLTININGGLYINQLDITPNQWNITPNLHPLKDLHIDNWS